jgi:hypothetical protein
MIFHPGLTPLIGQALTVVTVTGHAVVEIHVATDIQLRGRFRHIWWGQRVGSGRWKPAGGGRMLNRPRRDADGWEGEQQTKGKQHPDSWQRQHLD